MFDVGQQKDMLRATGNSPTEHLSCSELPGNLGKAGGRRGATEQPGDDHPPRGFGNHRDNPLCFHRHLQIADRSRSPQSYPGLSSSLSPILTLLYSAHQRESSLFPSCHSLFLFHPGQYRKDLCPYPLLSDPEVKHVENIRPGRDIPEEPGSLALKATDSPPPPSDWAGTSEPALLGLF